MEKKELKSKNNRNPSKKSFGLAIIAVLMLTVLITISIIITLNYTNKDETLQISLSNGNLWKKIKITAETELYHIQERQKADREKELAKLQEDLAAEAINNQNENDLAVNDDLTSEDDSTAVAYLTFDDGPSKVVTEDILDLLAEEGIKATFFVLPREEVKDILKRIIDEGHELANHSYSHNFNRLYNRGIDAFTGDVLRAHNFVLDNTGYEMSFFRFPGGSMSWGRDRITERREALKEIGYIDFDWHIDSGDADPNNNDTSAKALAKNVLTNTNGREHVIILMHDFKWRQSTVEALPEIISGLREQGYRFDIIGNYPQDG